MSSLLFFLVTPCIGKGGDLTFSIVPGLGHLTFGFVYPHPTPYLAPEGGVGLNIDRRRRVLIENRYKNSLAILDLQGRGFISCRQLSFLLFLCSHPIANKSLKLWYYGLVKKKKRF